MIGIVLVPHVVVHTNVSAAVQEKCRPLPGVLRVLPCEYDFIVLVCDAVYCTGIEDGCVEHLERVAGNLDVTVVGLTLC